MQDQLLQVAGCAFGRATTMRMRARLRAMLPADDAVGGVAKYPRTSISADIYYRKVHIDTSTMIEECGEGE